MFLTSTSGSDNINGGSGDDVIDSGAGSDRLSGGSGNDILDGGSGSDIVSGNSGDDALVYVVKDNLGATDVYDGGSGVDTLRLVMTRAEWMESTFQEDLARYLAFIAAETNPVNGQAKNTEFQFTAFNLRVSKFESIVVSVDGVVIGDLSNEPITLEDDAFSTDEDHASLAFDVLENDSVPDLVKSVTFTNGQHGTVQWASGQPSLTDVVSPEAKLIYTPDAVYYQNLAVGMSATDTFTYTVVDADGSTSTATITVTITGTNDGPVAVADMGAVTENQALTINVLANDTDVDDGHVLTLAAATAPLSKGVATIVDNQLVFTPGADFDHLEAGAIEVVTLTYTVMDDKGETSSSTVAVTITGTNDAPIVAAALADQRFAEDTPLSFTLGAGSFTDVDAATLDYTARLANGGALPSWLTFDDATRTFAGTPSADFNGVLDIEVVASDGSLTASDIFKLTIDPVNDAPVAGNDNGATSEDSAITLNVLANDSDVDGDALLISTLPAVSFMGATLTIVNGQVRYDPRAAAQLQALNSGQSVTDSFTYNVSDGNGGTTTATVSVLVSGASDSGAVADTFATGEDNRVYLDVLANDISAGAKSLVGLNGTGAFSGTTAQGAYIQITNGQIFYDPQNAAALQGLNTGDSAVDTFTYSMKDANGVISQATVTMNVSGFTEGSVINSGITAKMTFNTGSGAPLSYTEAGMTVQSLYPPNSSPHLHFGNFGGDATADLYNHGGCCSTPYEFRYFNPDNGDTTFSLTGFTHISGSGSWTSSTGGSIFVSAPGMIDFTQVSGFQNVEWVRWDVSGFGTDVIDDLTFAA